LHGRPTLVSKVNTGAQLLYLAGAMLNAAVGFPHHEILDVLAVITFVTIVLSGYQYAANFTRRAWSAPLQQQS
jgi:hypothetical protein